MLWMSLTSAWLKVSSMELHDLDVVAVHEWIKNPEDYAYSSVAIGKASIVWKTEGEGSDKELAQKTISKVSEDGRHILQEPDSSDICIDRRHRVTMLDMAVDRISSGGTQWMDTTAKILQCKKQMTILPHHTFPWTDYAHLESEYSGGKLLLRLDRRVWFISRRPIYNMSEVIIKRFSKWIFMMFRTS